jgi:hypothetical protein
MKRPRAAACRSFAVYATVMGLRANATAMEVPSSIRDVATAATASGRNGSWLTSAHHAP